MKEGNALRIGGKRNRCLSLIEALATAFGGVMTVKRNFSLGDKTFSSEKLAGHRGLEQEHFV